MQFGEILKSAQSEGKEKHVPVIEVHKGKGEGGADMVHVIVGKETPHPNTIEHHISWIEVYGVKQDGQVINLGRSEFAPGITSPNTRFQVAADQFKAFCAVSYCNLHGVWQNCIDA